MGIGLLGPLQVNGGNGDGRLSPRDRIVLAALAVRVGEVVTADQLADALWPDTPPPTWHKSLQGCVVRIRKVIGHDVIETVDHGYRLTLPASDVDAREFERLVGRARELLEREEPDRAAYVVDEALALWRGHAVVELERWEPGRVEADRLEELRRDAEELRIEAALASGRHREVIADARRLVEEAPLRERRWELLALAQYRSGQQADALRTLHQLRHVLVQELGLDPGQTVVELEQAILRQDRGLLPLVTATEPSATCPYLGLVPYDIDDADAYFGRDADLDACRRRLADTGVLAVVGPSGSGKSSLVRAGVAASLKRDGERVVVITPGRRPMAALSAVRRTGRPVVLVVDQLEEAMSLCDDPVEVAEFFTVLAAEAGRGGLVVALRADRMGDLAAQGDFARVIEAGLYLLTPMTAESLREAIERPAREAGLRLEQGLVELLVSEVEGQPGALPHLSHALRQTWERREGAVLTLDGYRATGGIRDAVAHSAEQVHDELPVEHRSTLRDLMLRLVAPGPEGEPVRSRIPRRLLSVDEEHERVLERLVTARLVTSDDGVVEIAHEALARAWPRLQGWLDEDTEGQRILRHLSVAADTWDAMGRPDDELYRGTRLAQAMEWRARTSPELTPVEAAYLEAGAERGRQEEQSAAEQARHQARVNRRLRGLLAGVALLLVTAVVAGTLAVRQANRAGEATRTADARRVAAQAQLAGDVDRSIALALAAFAADPSTESRAGLLAALARSPQLTAVRPMVGASAEISPDGETIATLDGDHKVTFYDTTSYERLGQYDPYPGRDVEGIGGGPAPLAFSPDGTVLAMSLLTFEDGVVRLIDTSTFELLPEQPGAQPRAALPKEVELSRDGRYLAVPLLAARGGRLYAHLLYVWDLTRPERPLHRIEMPSDSFTVEFSPDNLRLHAAPQWNSDARPGMWTYSLRSGELVRRSPGGSALESSPDGRTLAYGIDNVVHLLDERTGRVWQRLTGPLDRVSVLTFSPDGRLVAALADDQAAYVWEAASGRLVEQIPLDQPAWAVEFSHDSEQLLIPYGGRLHLFDLTGQDRYVQRLHASGNDRRSEAFDSWYPSPYEPVAATGQWQPRHQRSVLSVVDRATGQTVSRLGLGWIGDSADTHAWSPDGRHLAVVDARNRLRVLDWRSGEVVATRRFRGSQLAYTSDGTRLFAEGPDGLVLLDADTLEAVTEPVALEMRVTSAEPGPGDDTAVVVTAQRTQAVIDEYTAANRWQVVDLTSGEVIRSGRLRQSATSMAVSPDRSRMAVAGTAGVEVVDLTTGASRMPGGGDGTAETEGQLATYSPDGRLLASADGSGRVSLWDGRSGELLGTVHEGMSRAAPVFLDDHTLLLQHADGAAYVWDTSEQHTVDTACRIVGRGLTRDEWQDVFGSREYVDVCA